MLAVCTDSLPNNSKACCRDRGRWEGGSETSGSLAWGEDNADIGLKETLSQVYIFGPLQKRHFFMSFFFFLTAAYFEPK